MELSIGSSLTISDCSVDGERVGSCEDDVLSSVTLIGLIDFVRTELAIYCLGKMIDMKIIVLEEKLYK